MLVFLTVLLSVVVHSLGYHEHTLGPSDRKKVDEMNT